MTPKTAFALATSRLRRVSYSTAGSCDPPLATPRWSLNPARHGGGTSAAMIWPMGRLRPQGPGDAEPHVVVLVRGVVVVAVRGAQVVLVVVPGAPAQPAHRAGLFSSRGMPRPSFAAQHRRPQAPTVRVRHMTHPRAHTGTDLRHRPIALQSFQPLHVAPHAGRAHLDPAV